ncbi:MAG: 3-deoxy-7-phosphoheptulonate synthase [Actinobacteria bacterium]|nr:MAG: 3-deoxy-7-phosphoheptulonate synthase [Actinomycetota bacterium]
MMVVMKNTATEDQIKHVIEKIEEVGAKAHLSKGKYKSVIGVIGDTQQIDREVLEGFLGVENIVPISKPYKLVSSEFKAEPTEIKIGDAILGGNHFAVIAGPCSVETEEQVVAAAKAVKEAGGQILRGGAYKPRTSPYSFQGLGVEGLKLLDIASKETGLPVVTEVLDPRDIEVVASSAAILQIGARNMQNFTLLTEAGATQKPILLKKSFSATIEELFMAAEYIVKTGNEKVILCERGIRTFEPYTRNTLDISAVPLIKTLSHLPIIVDPSHATGKRELIEPLSLATLAAGGHGVMIEVHPAPEEALCDGSQSITITQLKELMEKIKPLAKFLGKQGY